MCNKRDSADSEVNISWDGKDFQVYAMQLLQKRYSVQSPHSFQLVPDRHLGDLGMEAFSHDGYAYQCYVAEEPLSVQQRYEKQRNKLTADLAKLRKKQEEVKAMLGTVEIRKYVFLVHKFDSRFLLTHAATKAAEVLEWELDFIHPDFAIVVETLDDYVAEAASLHTLPPALVEVDDIGPAAVLEWAGAHDSLTAAAEMKLRKVIHSEGELEAVKDALLKQYIQGNNALEKLKTTAPDAYKSALNTKVRKEALLVLEHPPTSTKTNSSLVAIADELQANLEAVNSLLGPELARNLAWSAVADWLMRCPLDFGDPP